MSWDQERLLHSLEKLFEAAGYTDEDLQQFIEEAVVLKLENERLKAQIQMLRKASATDKSDRMSSKLRDALRE